MEFTFFNDSSIFFRSCDDPTKFKSINLDGFALDEPVDISEDVFKVLQGRLRGRHGKYRFSIMAGNPSSKTNWVYTRFFENTTDEYKVVQTTTYDNVFLPSDYVKNLEESYDVEYANRYLRGEWGSFEGLIYKNFSTEKHICNIRDKKHRQYLVGIDVGFRNPTCILVGGINDDKSVDIVSEYYKEQQTSDIILSEIRELCRQYPIKRVYIDPAAADLVELCRQQKIPVEDAENDIQSGISRVKMLFERNMIAIDQSCKNLIKELQSYRYEKDKHLGNFIERPLKYKDHACDSLRYLFTGYNPFKVSAGCGAGRYT
jgi:PBSX family phage terminase large subunit